MNARTRRSLAATLGLAGVVLPLAAAGAAQAAEDETEGFPSTQNPLQAVDAGAATLDSSVFSFNDAVNGDNRPDGANGTETEFPSFDPRFVEGPAGGLVKNGPLE